jgi:hypothetical protein
MHGVIELEHSDLLSPAHVLPRRLLLGTRPERFETKVHPEQQIIERQMGSLTDEKWLRGMGSQMAAVLGTAGSVLEYLVSFFEIDHLGFVQEVRSLAERSWIYETETEPESGKHLQTVSVMKPSPPIRHWSKVVDI